MGVLYHRYRAEEHLEDSESELLPYAAVEKKNKAFAAAEMRWVKAMQGATFEESQKAQRREPMLRRQSPMLYGPCSSLL